MGKEVLKPRPVFINYSEGPTPLFNGSAHRYGVWDCPYCGYGNYNDCDFWDYAANIHEIILNGRICKMDGIIVLSECPKCHQVSWCHRDLDCYILDIEMGMRQMQGIDKSKLDAEAKRRAEAVHTQWEGSQCQTCRNVWKIEKRRYYVSIHCGSKKNGWTRWGDPDRKCDRYCPYKSGKKHTLLKDNEKIELVK